MSAHRTLTDLRRACEEELEALYPAGVPTRVRQRFEREMLCLTARADSWADFLLFREIAAAAKRASAPLELDGSARYSILVYLLGPHDLNPMPAHYYCTGCGLYHEEPETTMGMDLPPKACPRCGTPLRRDGCALQEEFVWTAGRPEFEYRVAPRFRRLAQRCAEQYYAEQDQKVFPWEIGYWNSRGSIPNLDIERGVAVLPPGADRSDYPAFVSITADGRDSLCLSLAYDGELKRIVILGSEQLERLDALQWETGIPMEKLPREALEDISLEDVFRTRLLEKEEEELMNAVMPAAFYETAGYLSAMGNTYSDPECEDDLCSFLRVFRRLDFAEMFFSRDDVYERLCAVFDDRKRAFAAAGEIWTGRWRAFPEEIDPEMPPEIRELAGAAAYLNLRSSGQLRLLQLMRFAKYRKLDRYAYARMTFGGGMPRENE